MEPVSVKLGHIINFDSNSSEMILMSPCRSRQIEIRLKMSFEASKSLYRRPFSRYNSPFTHSVPTKFSNLTYTEALVPIKFSNLTYTKAPDQKIWCALVLLILGRTVPRIHLLYSKGNEKLALVDRHEKLRLQQTLCEHTGRPCCGEVIEERANLSSLWNRYVKVVHNLTRGNKWTPKTRSRQNYVRIFVTAEETEVWIICVYKFEFHQLQHMLYEDQYMRIIVLTFKPDESGISQPSKLAQARWRN